MEALSICVRRGDKEVLQGISFELRPQETLVIIGQSGCGKTTLLRALIGLSRIKSGKLFIFGQDVTKFSERDWLALRLRIGYCFQEGALFDSLNVFENICFPLKMHTRMSERAMRKKAEEKLRLIGMEGTLHLFPAELSGGMRRRVGLARALIMDPDLLLFDEPTAGLDPVRKNSIVDLIYNLEDELQVSSVVVTHDMDVADRLATRVGMLHEGKLLALDTPENIRNHQNPVVRGFVEGKLSAI